ncbi:MAG: hypothetical protein AAFY28_21300, partial [Actinomycetota bacterium]
MLSVSVASDLDGSWNLLDYISHGSITLDATNGAAPTFGNITGGGGAYVDPANGNFTFTGGVFNIGTNGSIGIDPTYSDNFGGGTLDFSGGVNSSGDFIAANELLPNVDIQTLLVRPEGTYSNADLDGTWNAFRVDGSGTITFDGNGNLTAGTYANLRGPNIFIPANTYTINADGSGTVTADTPFTNEVDFRLRMNAGRDIAILQDTTATTAEDAAPVLLLKTGGTYSTSDLEGTWRITADEAVGIVTFDSMGQITSGSYFNDEGNNFSLTGGSLSLDSSGNITGSFSSNEPGFTNFPANGALSQNKDVAGLVGNISTEDGFFILTRSDLDINAIPSWATLNGTALTIASTTGDDTLSVVETTTGGGQIEITRNGELFAFDKSDVSSILFQAGDGSDTVTITGGASAETAQLFAAGSVAFFANGYTVTATESESITVNGGAGDNATLFGSEGSDHVISQPNATTMTGTGFSLTANNFPTLQVNAGLGSLDLVEIVDTDGADSFRSFAEFSDIRTTGGSNDGLYRRFDTFDQVNSYAVNGNTSGAGLDLAEIIDTSGADNFRSFAEFSDIRTNSGTFAGLYRYASGYTQVNTYSVNGGTDDAAYFEDTPGDDTFTAAAAFADLRTTSGAFAGL